MPSLDSASMFTHRPLAHRKLSLGFLKPFRYTASKVKAESCFQTEPVACMCEGREPI